ncbi:MAG: FKBP-type peptidyl-prolyl cis-trans isomerase [Candidatus Kapaibacterium sp.]
MKYFSIFAIALAMILTAACSGPKEQTKEGGKYSDFETTKSGLKYKVIRKGIGDTPDPGDRVFVHYRGTLEDSTQFDTSYERDKPFDFVVGQGNVIKGWDEGLQMMHKGAKWIFVIPPDLAYGSRRVGKIPSNSTLVFEVELLDIKEKKK